MTKRIIELSKDELLHIIYHYVKDGNVIYEDHPCECVICDAENNCNSLYYICDECEKNDD